MLAEHEQGTNRNRNFWIAIGCENQHNNPFDLIVNESQCHNLAFLLCTYMKIIDGIQI